MYYHGCKLQLETFFQPWKIRGLDLFFLARIKVILDNKIKQNKAKQRNEMK